MQGVLAGDDVLRDTGISLTLVFVTLKSREPRSPFRGAVYRVRKLAIRRRALRRNMLPAKLPRQTENLIPIFEPSEPQSSVRRCKLAAKTTVTQRL